MRLDILPFPYSINIMFLYFLVMISIGVEGGYNIPAIGFNNLESGVAFAVFANHHLRIADASLLIGSSFYTGQNDSYFLNSYCVRCGFSKNNWRFSPFLEFGGEYMKRELGGAEETGLALSYAVGFLINFQSNNLRLYPKFFYEGLTDFKGHGGFVGMKLGIGYEI